MCVCVSLSVCLMYMRVFEDSGHLLEENFIQQPRAINKFQSPPTVVKSLHLSRWVILLYTWMLRACVYSVVFVSIEELTYVKVHRCTYNE